MSDPQLPLTNTVSSLTSGSVRGPHLQQRRPQRRGIDQDQGQKYDQHHQAATGSRHPPCARMRARACLDIRKDACKRGQRVATRVCRTVGTHMTSYRPGTPQTSVRTSAAGPKHNLFTFSSSTHPRSAPAPHDAPCQTPPSSTQASRSRQHRTPDAHPQCPSTIRGPISPIAPRSRTP